MNIKEYQNIIEGKAVRIDELVPARVSPGGHLVEGNIVFKDRKLVDINKFFKDNEIFSVRANGMLRKMIEDNSLKTLYITVHYGKDDIDYYMCDVNGADITENGFVIVFCSNPICFDHVFPDGDSSARSDRHESVKSTEGEKWDRILEKIDNRITAIEKLIKLSGLLKVDESELADEDFEDDEEDDVIPPCDEDETVIPPCFEDATGKEDNPTFDGYRCTDDSKKDDSTKKFSCSIEGEVGPDGIMKVVETDSDGKKSEKTVSSKI